MRGGRPPSDNIIITGDVYAIHCELQTRLSDTFSVAEKRFSRRFERKKTSKRLCQFDIIIIIITILCLERYDVNAGACYIDWTPPPPSADKDVVSGRRNERGAIARARTCRGGAVLVLPRRQIAGLGGGRAVRAPCQRKIATTRCRPCAGRTFHNIWHCATHFCGRRVPKVFPKKDPPPTR